MPTFTKDWFSANIPLWSGLLNGFKARPSRFLEIGSFEGRSTVWMLENILLHDNSSITCIDPYVNTFNSLHPDIVSEEVFARFKANTQPWASKVDLRVGQSRAILPDVTDRFDFVYVDGCHVSTEVYYDGVTCWPKVKVGGILIFDDYYFTLPGWEDWKLTRHGVDAALKVMKGARIVHHSHQVVVLKLRER